MKARKMKITKEDVGRRVFNNLGTSEVIIAFNEGEEYPVVTPDAKYTVDGVRSKRSASWNKIIKLEDQE